MRLAGGRVSRRPLGRVVAELKGEREEILCVFGDAGDLPTIGAHTLEAVLLSADTIRGELVPSEALWAPRITFVS